MSIKDTIRTPNDLRRWLIALAPIDVYNSANEFLSPSSMSYTEFDGKKSGWNISDNILLGDGVILVDTDFHNRTFNEAKQDALTILDYLHERGYVVDEIKATGQGFQLLVTKHDLFLPQVSPKARFNLYREKRKPILEDLQERGVQVDAEILLDAKRITRTVKTVNSKNGYVCTRVRELEGFENSDVERLRLEGLIPVTRKNARMTNPFLPHRKNRGRPQLGEGCAHMSKETKPDKPNPTQSTPAIYLATPVIGTDRQVILLRFKNPVNLELLKTGLSRFAAQEQLAPFIIFRSRKDPDGIWGLSPTAIQTAGMKRLLKRYPRDNSVYVKFRRRIVPLPLEYVGQSSGVIDSEIPVSRAHHKFFSHYGLASYVPRISCGNPNLLSMPIGEMNS